MRARGFISVKLFTIKAYRIKFYIIRKLSGFFYANRIAVFVIVLNALVIRDIKIYCRAKRDIFKNIFSALFFHFVGISYRIILV